MPPELQSPEIQAFATGFPITLMHIGVTVLILFLGAGVYILMTPHREIALIRAGMVETPRGPAARTCAATTSRSGVQSTCATVGAVRLQPVNGRRSSTEPLLVYVTRTR